MLLNWAEAWALNLRQAWLVVRVGKGYRRNWWYDYLVLR